MMPEPGTLRWVPTDPDELGQIPRDLDLPKRPIWRIIDWFRQHEAAVVSHPMRGRVLPCPEWCTFNGTHEFDSHGYRNHHGERKYIGPMTEVLLWQAEEVDGLGERISTSPVQVLLVVGGHGAICSPKTAGDVASTLSSAAAEARAVRGPDVSDYA